MDTTLRDGEQTEGVSFSSAEKLLIAQKLLLDVEVDRIEIASARVSEGEKEACAEIFKWAKGQDKARGQGGTGKDLLGRIEVLSFVDRDKSVDWVASAGGKAINLLCKGSEKHCGEQLHKSPEEHFADIAATVAYARSKGFAVNAYLEDFSNGISASPDYVRALAKVLEDSGVKRIMLADTLGVMSPEGAARAVGLVRQWFSHAHLDFHAHNDYGLATANTLAAVNAGCDGVHCTVNGLGERTGNAALEEVIAALHDFSKKECGVSEKSLVSVSRIVETFSKQRVSRNKPIVGTAVFTQTAGIHADGDKKGGLYRSRLSAERFGRTTKYALGKLSGKASVEMALREMGMSLDEGALSEVLKKVVELGDKKETVTKEDLPFIMAGLQNNGHAKDFEVLDFEFSSKKGEKPAARVKIRLLGKEFESKAFGDGSYDAFMNALREIFSKNRAGLNKACLPDLVDYEVRIPPGGRTDALVETKITWNGLLPGGEKKQFETVGVSTDQIEAALRATEKAINLVIR